MSNTIDKRVVEMGFDNKQFESGVQTSIKSVGDLKKGLNLDASAKSLANLGNVGKSFSLSNIGEGVSHIASGFSAMGVIGFTVLQNLTNMAFDLGKKLLDAALGIDQMQAGFGSYEVKINAVKTVMAGTGETIDQVTQSLNDLNNYSDRTIYSFQDMTENISKFTNAGMSSKDAATAIMGISNVAAISGANTQEAARAMYNFGQAIQQGSVRLMDWKSIENANMATIDFKQQLIDTAVAMGTLTKATDGTYKTLSGEVLSATKNFNGSLEKEWLTTKVLTGTLADYASQTTEIGKKANAAAQEVTTFTQMMATAQDSTKTGWTKTWQIVFGDLFDAKKLFTEISNIMGNFISSSANTRNTLIQSWKDNGGRLLIIDAFRNSFEALSKIMDIVKEAFKSILPPITGLQLAVLSYRLYKLTTYFTISAETADKLKRIFVGIASVVSLVSIGISKLITAFLHLATGPIVSAGGGLLDFAAKLGDWLFHVSVGIKSCNLLGRAYSKLGIWISDSLDRVKKFLEPAIKVFQDFIKIVSPIVGPVFQKIGTFFANLFKDVDTSSIKAFGSTIGTVFGNMGKVIAKIGGYLEPVRKSFDKFIASVGPIFVKLKDLFSNLFKSIKTDDVSRRFQPLTTMLGLVGKVCLWLWQVLTKVAPIFLKIGSFIAEKIGGLGNAIIEGLTNLDYNNIFSGLNGGLIAALILAIKKFVDTGSGVLGGANGILGGVTGILDGVKTSLQAYQTSLKSKALMSIAIAIAILAASVVALSLVDSTKLTFALGAIGGLFAGLLGSITLFNKEGGGLGFEKTAAGLVLFTSSLLIMTTSVLLLAKLKPEELANGLSGVGLMLAGLATFMKVTAYDNMSIKTAIGLNILAVALLLMSTSVLAFGSIDPDKLKQGLIGVGIVLAELALFVNLTGDAKKVISTAIGLNIIAVAMLIFAKAVEQMGSMSWDTITKGLTTMGLALGIVTLAMNLLPPNMILNAISLTIVAASLVILTTALTNMGAMSWEEIGKSLTLLAASLTILTLAMIGMTEGLPGAAAMLVIAPALVIMSDALIKMGGMSWDEIARGLVVLGGSLLIIAGAMVLMTEALPGAAALLVVSAALWVLAPVLKTLGSMSLTEIGLALLAIAGFLTVIGVAGALLTPVIPTLFGLAASIVLFGVACLAIGTGVMLFATGLAMLAVSGAGAAVAIVLIVTTIISLVPIIIKTLMDAIILLAQLITEAAPVLVLAITTTLLALIAGIVVLVPAIVEAALTLIEAFLTSISDHLPDILQKGYDILHTLLKGVRDNIGETVTLVGEIIVAFVDALAKQVKPIADAAFNFITTFLNDLSTSIDEHHKEFQAAGIKLAGSILTAAVDGLWAGASAVIGALGGIMQAAIDNLWRAITGQGPKEPEKVGNQLGDSVGDGVVNGITNSTGRVGNAASNLGNVVTSNFNASISNVSDKIRGQLDLNPTIRPVLDLSDIVANKGKVKQLLGNGVINLSGTVNRSANVATNMQQSSPFSGTLVNPASQNQGTSITLNQNNYSPKALSRLEIYRQTRNQLNLIKGLVTNA